MVLTAAMTEEILELFPVSGENFQSFSTKYDVNDGTFINVIC
jgi:hypothetical protein